MAKKCWIDYSRINNGFVIVVQILATLGQNSTPPSKKLARCARSCRRASFPLYGFRKAGGSMNSIFRQLLGLGGASRSLSILWVPSPPRESDRTDVSVWNVWTWVKSGIDDKADSPRASRQKDRLPDRCDGGETLLWQRNHRPLPEEQGLRCCWCHDEDQQLRSCGLLLRYPPGPGPHLDHIWAVLHAQLLNFKSSERQRWIETLLQCFETCSANDPVKIKSLRFKGTLAGFPKAQLGELQDAPAANPQIVVFFFSFFCFSCSYLNVIQRSVQASSRFPGEHRQRHGPV